MDVQGIVNSIAQQLADNLDAEICTIRVPEGKKMKLIAAYGIDIKSREESVDIEGTIVGQVFESGESQIIFDITKDKRYNPEYITYKQPTALMAIPLKFENHVLGVAQIYSKNFFNEKQKSLAETLAQFAALTIYNNQFRKITRKSVLKIIEGIIEGNTFEEISKKAAEQIIKNLQVERCTIYRIFKNNNQLWCEISAGVPSEEHGIGLKEEVDKHPDIKAALENKKFYIIDNPKDNPLTFHFIEIVKTKKINTILYLPIKEEIVLVVDATKEKKFFTQEEIEFCSDVSYILYLIWKRIQKDLQDFRHLTINPMTIIGGWSKRIMEIAKLLNDEAQRLTQNIPEKI